MMSAHDVREREQPTASPVPPPDATTNNLLDASLTPLDDVISVPQANPLNVHAVVQSLVDRLRRALADQISETIYLKKQVARLQQQLGFTRATRFFPEPPTKVPTAASDNGEDCSANRFSKICAKLHQDNQDLRLFVEHQKRLTAAAHRRATTVSPDGCHCSALLESALKAVDQATLYDTEDWLNRLHIVEADRERFALMVIRLTDRLARTEALIRQDPILCGAFHQRIAEMAAGDVISQMHDAFAQLAVAQATNAQLEQRLDCERSIYQRCQVRLQNLRLTIESQLRALYDYIDDAIIPENLKSASSCALLSGVRRALRVPNGHASDVPPLAPQYNVSETAMALRLAERRIEADAHRITALQERIQQLEDEAVRTAAKSHRSRLAEAAAHSSPD